MKMSPFVYRHIGDRDIVITPEAGEVQAYRWVPLKFFETANGASANTKTELPLLESS